MCNTSSGTSGRRYAPAAGGVHVGAPGPHEPAGGLLLLQVDFTPVQQVLRSQWEFCSCCRRTSRRCSRSSGANGRRHAPAAGGVHASATGPQEPMGGGMLLLQEEFTPVQQVLRSQREEVCSCRRRTSRRWSRSSGASGPQNPTGEGRILIHEDPTPVQQVLGSQQEKVGSCYKRIPHRCSRSSGTNRRR